MREVFNPYAKKETEVAVAAAVEKPDVAEKEVSTASALSNVNPSICPKCGVTMGKAKLFNKREVYYCDTCRVSHPIA